MKTMNFALILANQTTYPLVSQNRRIKWMDLIGQILDVMKQKKIKELIKMMQSLTVNKSLFFRQHNLDLSSKRSFYSNCAQFWSHFKTKLIYIFTVKLISLNLFHCWLNSNFFITSSLCSTLRRIVNRVLIDFKLNSWLSAWSITTLLISSTAHYTCLIFSMTIFYIVLITFTFCFLFDLLLSKIYSRNTVKIFLAYCS